MYHAYIPDEFRVPFSHLLIPFKEADSISSHFAVLMETWDSPLGTAVVDRSIQTSYALTDGPASLGGGPILASSSSSL